MAIPLFDVCTKPLKLMWGAPELMFCASNRTASELHRMGSAVGLVPVLKYSWYVWHEGSDAPAVHRVSPYGWVLSIPPTQETSLLLERWWLALSQTKHSDVSCNLKQRDNLLLCNPWVGEAPLSQEAPRGCWLYWFQLWNQNICMTQSSG